MKIIKIISINLLFSSLFSMYENRKREHFELTLAQAEKIDNHSMWECASTNTDYGFINRCIEGGYENNILFKSAFKGDIEEVEKNISSFDINDINYFKRLTPLMGAIIALGDPELNEKNVKKVIKFLLDQKDININAKDCEGNTPLMYLVKSPDINVLESFLNRSDIDINLKNDKKETAAIVALIYSNYLTLQRLLKDPKTKFLIQFFKFYISRYKENKEDLDFIREDNEVENENIENLKNIIESEKDTLEVLIDLIEQAKEKLFNAIKQNNFEDFKYNLLRLGSVYVIDNDGNNILHYAINAQNVFFIKLILSKWPELFKMKNNLKKTPFQDSLKNNKIVVFKEFLKDLDNENDLIENNENLDNSSYSSNSKRIGYKSKYHKGYISYDM